MSLVGMKYDLNTRFINFIFHFIVFEEKKEEKKDLKYYQNEFYHPS